MRRLRLNLTSMSSSQEFSIVRAKAAVMVYEDKTKKWIPSMGMNGFANVHIYQHTTNNSFRIVGRLIQDHSVRNNREGGEETRARARARSLLVRKN